MVKTAPLAEISLKYIKLACIWKDFYRISRVCNRAKFQKPLPGGAVTVAFHSPGVASYGKNLSLCPLYMGCNENQ